MQFSDFAFIFLILPLVIIIHFLIKKQKSRNVFLTVFSLVFYMYCDLKNAFLLFCLIVLVYYCAIKIDSNTTNNKKKYLILYIVLSAGLLIYFKYTNLIITTINSLIGSNISLLELALPLGISFYIFQSIAYLSDVYNGRIKAEKKIVYILLFLTFFPTVSSGPILRYQEFSCQLIDRKVDVNNIANGLRRFIVGLSKKIIIANQIGIIATYAFDNIDNLGIILAWGGAMSYMIQIYFDFSGYSDMAIGIGEMLGFVLPENFNQPYSAISIKDFWSRWHMSLSTWFKDYIYIPLGGSRCSKIKTYRNILIVWSLTGLWHGASFSFVVWGLYFGLLLIIEKNIGEKKLSAIPKIIRHFLTLFILIIGWVLFRAGSIGNTAAYLKEMVNVSHISTLMEIKLMDIIYLYPVVIIGVIFSTPYGKRLYDYLDKKMGVFLDCGLACAFVLCIVLILNSSYSPFIYFNF